MSFKEVYITNTSSFFPNQPVSNDEMEEYLGCINNQPSKSKSIVLRNNGIKRRFYAITKGGSVTHSNAQMASLAIRKLFDEKAEALQSLELISCGTSSPDQLMPSHAAMVHGFLPETNPVEVVSPSGVCCAGMHALKYAYMSTKLGVVSKAVATGSERISVALKSSNFEDEVQKLKSLHEDPYVGFEKEFLRWMLSDGAAAFLIADKKNEEGISLKIEWLEGFSYANELPACMYMGAEKMPDGHLKSYMEFAPHDILDQSVLSIKQDVKLLGKNIIAYGGKALKASLQKHGVNVDDVTYFLPHMSSEFFKEKIFQQLIADGIGIPYEKWFVNLSQVGNVGSASIYLMVDELFHSGKLVKGDKILLLVPESARFSYMFGLLTVC